MKIRFDTPAAGLIAWKGNNEIVADPIHFTMDLLRSAIHGLVESVRSNLMREMLCLQVHQDG